MSKFGYPEVYGLKPDASCGHCSASPKHSAYTVWGRFCLACWRWCDYNGPKQWWGDGMDVRQIGVVCK